MNEPKRPQEIDAISELNKLEFVPERDKQQAKQGRANFLAEAETFDQAVSHGFLFRLNEWINKLPLPKMEKEYRPMFTAIVTGLTALVVFVSGVGATVLVSQDALPGDTLFSVKTSVEDVRLLFGDDEADLALHQQLIDLREAEIEDLQDAERTEDVEVAVLDIAKHEAAIEALKAKLGLEDPAEDNSNSSNDNTDTNSNSNDGTGDSGNSNDNSNDDDNGNDNSDDDDDDDGDDNSNDNDDDGDDNSNDNDDDDGDDNSNDNDDDGDDNSNDNDGDDNSNDSDDHDDEDDDEDEDDEEDDEDDDDEDDDEDEDDD